MYTWANPKHIIYSCYRVLSILCLIPNEFIYLAAACSQQQTWGKILRLKITQLPFATNTQLTCWLYNQYLQVYFFSPFEGKNGRCSAISSYKNRSHLHVPIIEAQKLSLQSNLAAIKICCLLCWNVHRASKQKAMLILQEVPQTWLPFIIHGQYTAHIQELDTMCVQWLRYKIQQLLHLHLVTLVEHHVWDHISSVSQKKKLHQSDMFLVAPQQYDQTTSKWLLNKPFLSISKPAETNLKPLPVWILHFFF